MKTRSLACGAITTVLIAALCAACGSESDASGNGALDPGPGDNDGGPGGDQGDGGPGGGDAGGRCGTVTSSHPPVPINLAVMFDTSKSLVQDANGDNTKTRWEPVTSAMKAFFADAQTAGVNAALHFFPVVERNQSVCAPQAYRLPVVARTALPSAVFASSIAKKSPEGGSPMVPAVTGAVDAAKRLAADSHGERAAIVLVTDGGPNDCNSDYAAVRDLIAKAKAGSPSISTVVVAVGPEASNLDVLAEAGGTQKAIVVSPGDPAKAAQELRTRVAALQATVASCSVALPAPAGHTVDRNAVTVTLTPGSGPSTTLPYNEACAGNGGWHFSSSASPATVSLCDGSCHAFATDSKASVSVAFQCVP